MDVDGRVLRLDTSVRPVTELSRLLDHRLQVQQSACPRNAIGLDHKQQAFPPETGRIYRFIDPAAARLRTDVRHRDAWRTRLENRGLLSVAEKLALGLPEPP